MVVYSTTVLECLLLERPRCCGCGCCYWCCCSGHFWQVKDDVQSVFLTALSCLSLCLFGSSRVSPTQLPLRTVRPLAWLLATFCAVTWRCACVARCQHGSTMRCATMSCVCSTRGTPQAMNSHLLLAHLGPSRRPRAPPGFSLRSHAPPGPQLLFLTQLVLPEHSLPSRSS